MIFVQAHPYVPRSELSLFNEDPSIRIQFDSSNVLADILVDQSVADAGQRDVQNVYKRIINLPMNLSKPEDLAVLMGLISLEGTLKDLTPAIPTLTNASTILAKSLPRLSEILSQFTESFQAIAGTEYPSHPEVQQEVFDTMRELYPALDEGFKHAGSLLSVFANILLVLPKDLPYLFKNHPTLAQHVSTFAGVSNPKPRDSLSTYEETVPLYYASVPEFQKEAVIAAAFNNAFSREASLGSDQLHYFSPSYYHHPSYYLHPSYYYRLPYQSDSSSYWNPSPPVIIVPGQQFTDYDVHIY